MGPWYGPFASLEGSELQAPVLKVVYNGGIIIGVEGFQIIGAHSRDSREP